MACANPERVAEKEASSIAVSPDCKQFQPWYVCMQILIYQFNKVLPTFQSVSGDVPGIDRRSHSSHNSLPSVEFAPEVNNRKHNCAKFHSCTHTHTPLQERGHKTLAAGGELVQIPHPSPAAVKEFESEKQLQNLLGWFLHSKLPSTLWKTWLIIQ